MFRYSFLVFALPCVSVTGTGIDEFMKLAYANQHPSTSLFALLQGLIYIALFKFPQLLAREIDTVFTRLIP
jgi:hypothetical protein